MQINSFDYWAVFAEGQKAYAAGLRYDRCPYEWRPQAKAWIDGWARPHFVRGVPQTPEAA